MTGQAGHLKTAEEVLAGVDLSVKRVLVTGASGGLGQETVRALGWFWLPATARSSTADGLESQFGVCHIGHFLLTCLLMPALIGAGDARVVNLSSGGHKIAPVDFDDPNPASRRITSQIQTLLCCKV